MNDVNQIGPDEPHEYAATRAASIEALDSLGRLNQMLEAVFANKPVLRGLIHQETLGQYLDNALHWNVGEEFAGKQAFLSRLGHEVARLYGDQTAAKVTAQMLTSFVLETGAHLHLPRRQDKVSKSTPYNVNAIIFQGQILWAAANAAKGHSVSISFSSSRVPVNNANSATYLDLPALEAPVRLVSDRYKESPQYAVPGINEEARARLRGQLAKIKGRLGNDHAEVQLLESFLVICDRHPDHLSDQAALMHSTWMNQVLSESEITPVTIDSESVAAQFLADMLADKSSVVGRIFADAALRQQFLVDMAGIPTGWEEGEIPFNQIDNSGKSARLQPYTGNLDPDLLAQKLRAREILPYGILKFFCLISDAGVCPIGGMMQSGYLTELRNRSEKFLQMLGEARRADKLATMPTDVAIVSPCWGIALAQKSLLNGVDALNAGVSKSDLQRIIQLSGRESLAIAAPTLYAFMCGETPPLGYGSDLAALTPSAILR
ncbi:MAG: hypothetical protein HY817_00095 [Candidatus Abawacabacteria bacterium]|nr:hypothetical protein [Candidatus Abawacabacteria bacterium]